MSFASDVSRSSNAKVKRAKNEPTTPRRLSNSHLTLPMVSPIPIHRLSPALDEFSLRRTPSRGGTASPAPAKGVRKRLHQYRNLNHAVDLLKQRKNIVVLTGAGISTSVGIPDFRSDKGLYSQLSKDLGITEAEEFFSRDYFIHNTEQFFQYVKRVIPEAVLGPDGVFMATNPAKKSDEGGTAVPEFSLTHAFLALLHWKKKLLTNYTQNIDGLETAAGVPDSRFIQCHGSWDTASCMTCGKTSAAKRYLPVVFAGNIPFCKCKLDSEKQGKQKRKLKPGKKRSWDDFDSDHSSDDGTQAPRGLLKPDITFFNERLSGSYGHRLDKDKRKIDLLIIIGTSLKVGPVQDMLYQISPNVPQIFISKERFSGALCNLPGVQVDVELLGECDIIIKELCRRAGWSEELDALCWEKGQMKIKIMNRTAEEALRTFEGGDGREDGDNGSELTNRNRDVQESKGASEQVLNAPNEVKAVLHQEEDPTKLLKITTTSMATADINVSRVSEVSIKDSVTSMTQIDQHAPLDVAEVKVAELQSVVQPSSVSKSTPSGVKIELVEGTAHQWRISRK